MSIRRLTDAEKVVEFRLQLDESNVREARLRDELFEARRIREAAEKHAKWQDEQNARLREALEGVCGTTGAWTQRVRDGERDWRVRFSFEGETHFETQDEAREACQAYERIVADAVHGDELARLRAEVERLRAPDPDEGADYREVATSALDSCDRYRRSLAEARAEVERLRVELVLAIDEAEHGHNCSFCGCDLTGPPPWVHGKDCMVASMRDALTREDGEGS